MKKNDLINKFNKDKVKFIEININLEKIISKNDIFNIFSENLGFPNYFGKNWDGFWDILYNRDFINNENEILINLINIENLTISDKDIFKEIINDLNSVNGFYIFLYS
ncbi:MAG: barstar family protein [Candidatus Gracilibacteria bacterium]|nr:barstar family protein [Candidatus Gracilibacteria bacterium]